jgi:hypothetical protein
MNKPEMTRTAQITHPRTVCRIRFKAAGLTPDRRPVETRPYLVIVTGARHADLEQEAGAPTFIFRAAYRDSAL